MYFKPIFLYEKQIQEMQFSIARHHWGYFWGIHHITGLIPFPFVVRMLFLFPVLLSIFLTITRKLYSCSHRQIKIGFLVHRCKNNNSFVQDKSISHSKQLFKIAFPSSAAWRMRFLTFPFAVNTAASQSHCIHFSWVTSKGSTPAMGQQDARENIWSISTSKCKAFSSGAEM